MKWLLISFCLWALPVTGSAAPYGMGESGSDSSAYNASQMQTQGLEFEQRLGAQLPVDADFVDHDGKRVVLGDYFGKGKPVVFALAYYSCPNICTVVFRETFQALQQIDSIKPDKYTLVFVSINPKENPGMAAEKRRKYLGSYRGTNFGPSTHFLVGTEDSIKRVADAIGFRYRYDEATGQYLHASGITVATPEGKLSRYLYGVRYKPNDLRLSLVEASNGKIGSPVDKFLLFCYKYDPERGKYGFLVMRAVRIGGGLTVLALAGFVFFMTWRDRRRRQTLTKESYSVR